MKSLKLSLLVFLVSLMACEKKSNPPPADTTPVQQDRADQPASPESTAPTESTGGDVQSSGQDDKITFDFIHTKQNCAVVENGIQRKSTFCLNENNEDLKKATDLSGMVDVAVKQLDTTLQDPKNSSVFVAYFSFSNKGIQRKFCELSSKGVQLRVFLDKGSTGQIDDLVMNNSACKDETGKLNVKLTYLGGNTNGDAGSGGLWQLHHNKFMLIEVPNKKIKLNFSSGNLSAFGTSLHLDHWVMIEAPANTNLVRAHKCVMQGLDAAATKVQETMVTSDQTAGQTYIAAREKCFDKEDVLPRQNSAQYLSSQIDSVLKTEEIAPLFSPNNNQYVEKSFIAALNKVPAGGNIHIAVQHFLHSGVSYALTKAAQRGVDIRIIMDDDALRGESEVPGVDAMIKKLSQVEGIKIRFAETNRNAGGNGAMMHNKFAILNGTMTFSGAGHYTRAAMNMNWENFYFATNKTLIKNYQAYFQELWKNSVDIQYSASKGTIPSSAPLAL